MITIGLWSLMVAVLSTIGAALNYYIPWQWFTDFFSIVKFFTASIDFMWNTSLMWTLVGYVFGAEVIYIAWPLFWSLVKEVKSK